MTVDILLHALPEFATVEKIERLILRRPVVQVLHLTATPAS